ncbi:MAG: isocitrate/isopropylmalate dehydrogenase family protein [Nanoarchaeota archaeon]|nr:isocitrate/isopropylmalate dehydrogenase family protein [Nanoarchaeota archaeon]
MNAKRPYRICVLPGDGIGKEVIPATVMLLQSLPKNQIDFEFTYDEVGYGFYQKSGTPLKDETLEKVRASDAALFGAITTPPNIPDYFSVIIRLRQRLDLYSNLRPTRFYPIAGAREGVDLMIFRENTEGLYSGIERVEDDGNTAITERIITRKGSERIIRAAFEYAKKNSRKKVTLVHKANVLRESDGLFKRIGQEISSHYSSIRFEEMIVDAMAMRLIKDPENFDVIVTTNLFGDILSDEASMLCGGLGFAASGNIGDNCAIFEPVHGSAPDIAGKGIANPYATVLAAKMMLEYLDESGSAAKIDNAVIGALKVLVLTKELGGKYTTSQVIDELIKRIRE